MPELDSFKDSEAQEFSLMERTPLPKPLDMDELFEKAKQLSPEQVREKVNKLNARLKMGGQTHEIEVAVDPSAHTWACARVPKKIVQQDETSVQTNFFHYIIVMPYEHLAIDDDSFILGELRHELGHALYTDWRLMDRLSKTVEKEGYNKGQINRLLNCLEDPRMEHVSTLPKAVNGHIKRWFWSKNKQLILGNIGNGIKESNPVDQFDFLIKLFSLWAIHREDADKENIEVWDDISGLNPSVIREWELVKDEVSKIVGLDKYIMPEMRSSFVEKAIREVLWPAKKRLIDEFGESPEPEPGEGGEPGESGEGGEGKGTPSPTDLPQNPDDLDNLPPEIQQTVNNQIDQYNKSIEKQQQAKKEANENAKNENEKIENEKQERLKRLDGMSNHELRKKYESLKKEAGRFTNRMSRLFEKYFPKVAYPKDIYKRKGKEYSAREHLKRFGSGMEKPMASPNTPEKSGLVLQIIVDISGSMNGDRINQAVKTVIGMLEAAQDYPIHIEILASDDKHGGIDPRYILKAFNEEFSGAVGGKIKERLVEVLDRCSEGNEDDESLKWAVPRIVKKRNELMSQYENIAALTIFLSDAEVPGQQDKAVVDDLRKKVAILGGCVAPDSKIKASVQAAYGPIGEGSFCPDSLDTLPQAFEKLIRKKIRGMFNK